MSFSVHIKKRVGNFQLSVDMEHELGITGLLGASGCGKSMTLKCIAGIEKPDEGRIVLNGRVLYDSEKRINLRPQDRRVGYLFQNYALFPNMTVEKNILCGLCREKKKEAKYKKLEEILPSFFARCHKSFIVNKNEIQSLDPLTQTMKLRSTGEKIPYGKYFELD